jgi:hypothetical protein
VSERLCGGSITNYNFRVPEQPALCFLLLFRYLATVRTFTSKLCRSSRQRWKTAASTPADKFVAEIKGRNNIEQEKYTSERKLLSFTLGKNFARIPRHYISFVSVGYIGTLSSEPIYTHWHKSLRLVFVSGQISLEKPRPRSRAKVVVMRASEHLLSSC